MKRDALFRWIDQYLEVGRYGDYSPIGLQVEGAPEVTKVALGVSAHLQLIEEAAAWGAQAILVHHGFFWPGEPQVITGWRKLVSRHNRGIQTPQTHPSPRLG